jgi:hypothetical protein
MKVYMNKISIDTTNLQFQGLSLSDIFFLLKKKPNTNLVFKIYK